MYGATVFYGVSCRKGTDAMDNLTNIGVIRDVLGRHGFTFSKALGKIF